jgi:LPXTG-motif cell wall-anchored protein
MKKLGLTLLAGGALVFALPGLSHAGSPGGPYTTSTISVSPNPTNPGTTVTATSTHQILGLPPQGQSIQLEINLSNTNGNGTLDFGTSSSSIGLCGLEQQTRTRWLCTFRPGELSVGDTVTLTAPVIVDQATPTPDSFSVAGLGTILVGGSTLPQPDSSASTQLAVEAVQPPTTSTTTTTTTVPDQTTTVPDQTTTVPDQTTTVPASTVAPTTVAPPTTGSGGVSPNLPATGSESEWLALFGLLTLAAGLLAVGYARRPSSS